METPAADAATPSIPISSRAARSNRTAHDAVDRTIEEKDLTAARIADTRSTADGAVAHSAATYARPS